MQMLTYVNESGLYSLILSSKMESAREFKRWVTAEVLPAIRKAGGYIATSSEVTDEEIMARAILIGQKTIERQKERILQLGEQATKQTEALEEAAPKVRFAEAVGKSDDTISVDLMAKLLAQNGVPCMGGKRLFAVLRREGYISDQRNSWNRPYQKWVERGIFKVETSTWKNPTTGTQHVSYVPRITVKGQQHFVEKYCSNMPQLFGQLLTTNANIS